MDEAFRQGELGGVRAVLPRHGCPRAKPNPRYRRSIPQFNRLRRGLHP